MNNARYGFVPKTAQTMLIQNYIFSHSKNLTIICINMYKFKMYNQNPIIQKYYSRVAI